MLSGPTRFQGTGKREARYVIAIVQPVSEAMNALAAIQIEEWRPYRPGAASFEQDVDMLGEVLHAVVHAGAGVSFIVPFSQDEARAFWREKVLPGVRARTRRVVVARSGARIVGTVQLDLAMPPNQQHRAEVAKMLVHPDARRRGVARALMMSLEAIAQAEGRTLLTLDTVTGGQRRAALSVPRLRRGRRHSAATRAAP